jgi:hypothetical protein
LADEDIIVLPILHRTDFRFLEQYGELSQDESSSRDLLECDKAVPFEAVDVLNLISVFLWVCDQLLNRQTKPS